MDGLIPQIEWRLGFSPVPITPSLLSLRSLRSFAAIQFRSSGVRRWLVGLVWGESGVSANGGAGTSHSLRRSTFTRTGNRQQPMSVLELKINNDSFGRCNLSPAND